MQVNLASPSWPTNPYVTEVPSPLLPGDFSALKDRKVHECFEAIVSQVLKAIMEQEKNATLTWSKVLQAEQGWRDKLLEEQIAAENDKSSWQTASGIFKKLASIILPLCFIVQGAAAIATGGVSIPILAVVVIGGLLLLDDLLDDPGKRAVAALLAKTNSEDTEAWLRRVCLVTSILTCAASIAIGLSTNVPHALKVVTTASGVALSFTQAGTEWGLNNKKAQLTTIDFSWEESTRRFSDLLNDTKKLMETANFMFEKNIEWQQSLRQTAGQIMSS